MDSPKESKRWANACMVLTLDIFLGIFLVGFIYKYFSETPAVVLIRPLLRVTDLCFHLYFVMFGVTLYNFIKERKSRPR